MDMTQENCAPGVVSTVETANFLVSIPGRAVTSAAIWGHLFVGLPRPQWSQMRDGELTIASYLGVYSSEMRPRRNEVVVAS
ncbi:hypothetical protein EVAR_46795_1 [Eumeta japonica]|uniref:Uncharacterized protein n=1 Tax=Eumeta variegata TaxID=151549 RepID=A0A4C1XFA8_EUMVA|nr:hypothetical protein EVAR_46795_1 [Eumeta japonica]